jgi:two-component system, LytTR family, response regulator
MTLRTIIADDEELGRSGLRVLLEQIEDVEIVRECVNGREAIEAIRELQPDLAYLDIQMPGKTGFDVIDAIEGPRCPHIVFVTAFDKYAVQAFEVHALDYLLKPINAARFGESIAHVRTAAGTLRDETTLGRLAQAAADLRECLVHPVAAPLPDRISVKTREGLMIVRVEDIDWVEADRDYVSLHSGAKTWRLRETITAVEERFMRAGFLRIHRSVLVNASRVRALRPLLKGEFTVILMDRTELKLSRNYRAAVERLLGDRFSPRFRSPLARES